MVARMQWILTAPTLMLALAVLTGCQGNRIRFLPWAKAPEIAAPCDPTTSACPVVQTPNVDTPRPKYRLGGTGTLSGTGEGFVEGVAVAQLDETTVAEKTAALKTDAKVTETRLGKTVASLGDVGQQGFWLRTPMVISQGEGRIVWADNGNSVNVTLIPKQGAATAGSQISLAAMRALGLPLTALVKLIVFTN